MSETIIEEKDKGVRWLVSPAIVGKEKDLNLKPNKFTCLNCKTEQSYSLDDVKIEVKTFGRVYNYATIAKDMAVVEGQKDFLSYLIERTKLTRKHREIIGTAEKYAGGVMRLKCPFCNFENIINVSVEATLEANLPHQESGVATVTLLDSDISPLDEELLSAYQKRPFPDDVKEIWNNKRFKAVFYRVKWTSPYEDLKGEDAAIKVFQRIKDLALDVERYNDNLRVLEESVEKTMENFKSDSSTRAVRDFLGDFRTKHLPLFKLKRQLAENLLWLHNQISNAVSLIGLESEASELVGLPSFNTKEEAQKFAEEKGTEIANKAQDKHVSYTLHEFDGLWYVEIKVGGERYYA